MIDGWQRGFAGRLTAPNEYLGQVPTITDIPQAVRTFCSHILETQPHPWITHVAGHPPGALLTFVWLDRAGLGGGAWAGLLCVLVGSSATAIIVALRALNDEFTARLAAPFVSVAPTVIWIAVSADGYFAGVAAWGLALLALAVTRTVRFAFFAALGAGLLLGWAIILNYGLTLMALPAVAILVAAGNLSGRAEDVGRRGANGRGAGGGVRRVRLLVVRRLYPRTRTLLARHRERPAVPVLELGRPRGRGVRNRTGQCGGLEQGV